MSTIPESLLRVSGSSNPQNVASAIAHAIYDSKPVKIRAVGAGAVNQSVKALAIARGYVAPRGIDLSVRPGFVSIPSRDNPDDTVTAITFTVLVS